MQTHVHVLPMGPGEFGVDCTEGGTTTNHKVVISEQVVDDLGLPDLDHRQLVEESFAFLLEREPNTAILKEFTLGDIVRYFPEYLEEMRTRLATQAG
jgi:hypothetical protein